MDIERLRQWVRGTLPRDERREVGRWMLRSTDPSIPTIIQGLIREHEEEMADAALRRLAPERNFVSEIWARLLESGRATLETVGPPAFAGGPVLGVATIHSGLQFRRVGGEIVVDVVLVEGERRVSLVATTDLGDEHLLLEPTVLQPGAYADVARWTPDPAEGRVAVWLALAAPDTNSSTMKDLLGVRDLTAAGSCEVIAARWIDPD